MCRIPQSPDSAQFTVIRYTPRNPKENGSIPTSGCRGRQKSLQSFFLQVCQTKPLRTAAVSSIRQTIRASLSLQIILFFQVSGRGTPYQEVVPQYVIGCIKHLKSLSIRGEEIPLLCSSHQGLQNSRQSFAVSGKSEFEFTFLYDTWFFMSSSGFKIIPIRRLYAITIDRQQPPIIQLLTVKHLHT